MLRKGPLIGVLVGSLIGSVVAAALVSGAIERVVDRSSSKEAAAAALVPSADGLILVSPPALAAVPNFVNFQGILTDSGGTPLSDGAHTVTFRIYDAAVIGNLQWEEIQSVTTSGGLFNVLLGSATAFPAGVFDGTPRYLEVQVESDLPTTPRQQFVSVPYAFHANTADSANSADVGNDLTCSGCVDSSDLAPGAAGVPAGAIILWDGAACPAGFTRVIAYDDKFLVGSGTAGTAGGSDTHTHEVGSYAHSHEHTVARTGAFGSSTSFPAGGQSNTVTIEAQDSNPHYASQDATTSGASTSAISGTSASADNIPAFKTILLCKRD